MVRISAYLAHYKELTIYLLKSKGADSIHSPFIFDFYNNVIKDKKRYPAYKTISGYRDRIRQDNSIIVRHAPAGELRKIPLAKEIDSSAIKPKYGELLYRIAKFSRPQTIVELGTNAGISTCYLRLGAAEAGRSSKLFTIEANEDLFKAAKAFHEDKSLDKNCEVNFTNGLFKEKLPGTLQSLDTLDLAFIDGDHQKDSTVQYFNRCAEKAHTKSVFIFDDIYWSKGMKAAWQEITKSPKVTLCLDLYRFGIVFFNPDLSKQVIRLRY